VTPTPPIIQTVRQIQFRTMDMMGFARLCDLQVSETSLKCAQGNTSRTWEQSPASVPIQSICASRRRWVVNLVAAHCNHTVPYRNCLMTVTMRHGRKRIAASARPTDTWLMVDNEALYVFPKRKQIKGQKSILPCARPPPEYAAGTRSVELITKKEGNRYLTAI
jgi:hypothetical protein